MKERRMKNEQGKEATCEMRTAGRTDPRASPHIKAEPSTFPHPPFFFLFLLLAEQPLLASGSGSADKMAGCSSEPRMK